MTQLAEIALSGLVGIAASLPPVLAIRFGLFEKVRAAASSAFSNTYNHISSLKPAFKHRKPAAKTATIAKQKTKTVIAASHEEVKVQDHIRMLKRCKKIPEQTEKQWMIFKAAAKHVESTAKGFTIGSVLGTIFKTIPSSEGNRADLLEAVLRWTGEDPEVIQVRKDENKTYFRIRELGGAP